MAVLLQKKLIDSLVQFCSLPAVAWSLLFWFSLFVKFATLLNAKLLFNGLVSLWCLLCVYVCVNLVRKLCDTPRWMHGVYWQCKFVEWYMFSKLFHVLCFVVKTLLCLVLSYYTAYLFGFYVVYASGSDTGTSGAPDNTNVGGSNVPNMPNDNGTLVAAGGTVNQNGNDTVDNPISTALVVAENKECCFGEEIIVNTKAMPSFVYKKDGDYSHIQYAKIVDVHDRHVHHAKFIAISKNIVHLPFGERKALVDGCVPSSEWSQDSMEDLFLQSLKNCEQVYNGQHTTVIKAFWLSKIEKMQRALIDGEYTSVKQKPFTVIRDAFLFEPGFEEVYADLDLVEPKRIFFVHYRDVLSNVQTMHNHSATFVSSLCKSEAATWSRIDKIQILTSSSYHGVNERIASVNFAGQLRDQYVSLVHLAVSDTTVASPVVSVHDPNLDCYMSNKDSIFSITMRDACKKDLKTFNLHTLSFLKNKIK